MTHRTRKNRLWKDLEPGFHQRTVMKHKCGKKCFLGPNKSFPICKKNTCSVTKKGVLAAYKRARQFRKKSTKYYKISHTARKLLKRLKE